MQILLTVDQQAALRRGINATSSTIKLDIDPATLTQIERDVLAAVLRDGHDATKLGLNIESDEFTGGDGSYSCNTDPLMLSRPDLDGLREAIGVMLAVRDEKRKVVLAVRDEKRAEARSKLDDLMIAEPRLAKLWLREDGKETTWENEKMLEVTYSSVNSYHDKAYNLAPDDHTRYNEWQCEQDARNRAAKAAAIEAARPELARLVKEKQAKADAEARAKADAEGKAKAERKAMIARLPEPFRARIRGGYATTAEVDRAIREMVRSDVGLADPVDYKVSRALKKLTDDEFVTLEQARADLSKRIPGAVVDPMEVADQFGDYRDATEDDDPDDIDDDGEVWEDDVNLHRCIFVSWQVAGLVVEAAIPFDSYSLSE